MLFAWFSGVWMRYHWQTKLACTATWISARCLGVRIVLWLAQLIAGSKSIHVIIL